MSKVKVIKASKELQHKAGTGEIAAERVQKAEKIIEQNTTDFQPIAQTFLDKLAVGIEHAKANDQPHDVLIAGMTRPVMELKANARMFKYQLISDLANIMLGFLETIKELDSTAIDIVNAHHKTLSAIVIKKMTGDGGANGLLLQTELQEAVQRYMRKTQQKPNV
jgi:hypothetical protein